MKTLSDLFSFIAIVILSILLFIYAILFPILDKKEYVKMKKSDVMVIIEHAYLTGVHSGLKKENYDSTWIVISNDYKLILDK